MAPPPPTPEPEAEGPRGGDPPPRNPGPAVLGAPSESRERLLLPGRRGEAEVVSAADVAAGVAAMGAGGDASPRAAPPPPALLGQEAFELPAEDRRPVRGAELSLHRVGATVEVPVASGPAEHGEERPSALRRAVALLRLRKPTRRREVLADVTGVVAPGAMVALMGPSGAGKTTLLDTIARRPAAPGARREGAVLLDGRRAKRRLLMHETAYIQQHDALMGYFTVFESIMFAALLKLPRHLSKAQRRAKVEAVITQMGLQRCRDTVVGNRVLRGVSGGEMKRVSIAVGLLQRPRAMFLDEPTSGLDSAIAADVMEAIKAVVSGSGCTLLITIHQPSPQVYGLFDTLLLLFAGRLAYFGPAGDAPTAALEAQGFPFGRGISVPEFLLETLNLRARGKVEHDFGLAYQASPQAQAHRRAAEKIWHRYQTRAPATATATDAEDPYAGTISVECFPRRPRGAPKGDAAGGATQAYQNGFARELWLLVAHRCAARWRSPFFLFTRVVSFAFYAAVYAGFFYGQVMTFSGVSNITALLFITIVISGFNSITQVDDLKVDRDIFLRETRDGYYRAVTFVTSKLVQEAPGCLLGAFIFSAVIYFPVELNAGAGPYLFYTLTFFVINQCAMVLAFAVGALFPGEALSSVIVPFLSTINSVVAGFLVLPGSIPAVWKWVYWISYYQWGWSALMLNQFQGQAYTDHCEMEGGSAPGIYSMIDDLLKLVSPGTCVPIEGDEILAGFSQAGRDKWDCLLYAWCAYPVFAVVFYWAMRRAV